MHSRRTGGILPDIDDGWQDEDFLEGSSAKYLKLKERTALRNHATDRELVWNEWNTGLEWLYRDSQCLGKVLMIGSGYLSVFKNMLL